MARKRRPGSGPVTKKQLSRKAIEDRWRFWLILGSFAALMLVVGVLALGAYQEYVAKPASPVAAVNDATIRVDDYQRRVLYRRFELRNYLARLDSQMRQFDPTDESQQWIYDYFQQQMQEVQNRLVSAATLVLDEMIDDELVQQEADRRGISATDDEVQLEIEGQFGYDRNPPVLTPTPITVTVPITVTPEPTVAPMTKEEFEGGYSDYITEIGKQTTFREEDFRGLMRVSLLRQKLQEALAEEVETSGEQVHARHILLGLEDRALAEEALERLRDGEDFAELASGYSTDESNKEEGGTWDGSLGAGWWSPSKTLPSRCFPASSVKLSRPPMAITSSSLSRETMIVSSTMTSLSRKGPPHCRFGSTSKEALRR